MKVMNAFFASSFDLRSTPPRHAAARLSDKNVHAFTWLELQSHALSG
jgi:hypothetical protein